jgi:hypothetical protein
LHLVIIQIEIKQMQEPKGVLCALKVTQSRCPYTLSPVTLSPVTFSRSFCPLVTVSLVTLSLGHLERFVMPLTSMHDILVLL